MASYDVTAYNNVELKMDAEFLKYPQSFVSPLVNIFPKIA